MAACSDLVIVGAQQSFEKMVLRTDISDTELSDIIYTNRKEPKLNAIINKNPKHFLEAIYRSTEVTVAFLKSATLTALIRRMVKDVADPWQKIIQTHLDKTPDFIDQLKELYGYLHLKPVLSDFLKIQQKALLIKAGHKAILFMGKKKLVERTAVRERREAIEDELFNRRILTPEELGIGDGSELNPGPDDVDAPRRSEFDASRDVVRVEDARAAVPTNPPAVNPAPESGAGDGGVKINYAFIKKII